MSDDENKKYVSAAEDLINRFAREVRTRDLCPACLYNSIGAFMMSLCDSGVLKHANEYTDEEKAQSPFFCDGVSFSLEAVPSQTH